MTKPYITDNVLSLSLLEHLSRTSSNRAALGSQAMFYLQGKGIPQDLRKGRTGLLVGARSYDRMSAARLALYYQKGSYGFNKDEDKAIFWRDRVSDWLRSDAALIYNDLEFKQSAERRYEKWKYICENLWGISVAEDDLPARQYRG